MGGKPVFKDLVMFFYTTLSLSLCSQCNVFLCVYDKQVSSQTLSTLELS